MLQTPVAGAEVLHAMSPSSVAGAQDFQASIRCLLHRNSAYGVLSAGNMSCRHSELRQQFVLLPLLYKLTMAQLVESRTSDPKIAGSTEHQQHVLLALRI